MLQLRLRLCYPCLDAEKAEPKILKEFINTDEVDKENIAEHEEWINDVDRGSHQDCS